nr:uncharacterized protein LOC128682833 isoform X4 [Plodia interpunctella]
MKKLFTPISRYFKKDNNYHDAINTSIRSPFRHAHWTDYDVFSSQEYKLMSIKMHKNGNVPAVSPSPNLTLVGLLSCGLTVVLGVVYTTLASLGIYYRSGCDAGIVSQSGPGSRFFLNTLLRLYFKKDDCFHSLVLDLDVTKEHTVFVLTCLTLTISLVCLLSAVAFISVLCLDRAAKFIEPVGYCYVVVIILSIAIELAMAIHFGMDYGTFAQEMNNSFPGASMNYIRDMYRLGALLLMIVSIKGGIIPVLNIVFIAIIIFCLIEFRHKVQSEGHSMHKVGALRAFDQPRKMDEHSENSFSQNRPQPKRNDDGWQTTLDSNYMIYRGAHANPAFTNVEDAPRSPSRDPQRSDYINPSFDRSYSWHQSQPSVASRPFSYLEDIKRQPPLKASSPVREPQWQRDNWDEQAPPLPAPDYSPQTPRRLKSALKSSYM